MVEGRAKEPAHVAHERLPLEHEAGGSQAGDDGFTIGAAHLAFGTGARALHLDLEVDVFRETLDQLPRGRKRRSTGKRRRDAAVGFERRDHAKRPHQMPVLFDIAFVRLQPRRKVTYMTRIKHARIS